ncbi:MAG: iron-sulfur cluster insertion protein ErpA, partial [Alphaproteobacteria bacterium]
LNLTQAAAKRIAHLSSFEDVSYFRVRVDGGGCSGFQYKFDFDTEKQIDDIEISAHGVTVLVDDMSQEFLQNSELDYVEELLGSFFKISNPNATASCGCGTSFSV